MSSSITLADIIIISIVIIALIVGGLYFLNRWAARRMSTSQNLIERYKQNTNIYVIDKKLAKAKGSSLPKAVMENLPKIFKYRKIPLVKAKIGAQITLLMCDKKVFNALPIKKNVKVELAGIYIVTMQGMKSNKEIKEIKKAKKEKKKNKST